jgi:hypothetical protein
MAQILRQYDTFRPSVSALKMIDTPIGSIMTKYTSAALNSASISPAATISRLMQLYIIEAGHQDIPGVS